MPKDDPNSFMGIFGAMTLDSPDPPAANILTDDTTYKFLSIPAFVGRSHSMETVCVQDNPCVSVDVAHEPSQPVSRQPSENEPYDPYDYCDVQCSTSSWDSANLLLLVCAGPAIFSLPKSFVHVGYLPGFALMLWLILLYAHNTHLVVWTEYQICKIQRLPNMSYPQALYSAFKMGPLWLRPMAPVARYFLYCTQKVVWFGCGHYSYIFIGRYLQIVVENVGGTLVKEAILLPLLIIPLLLLCWIPNLKYLASFSVVANVANLTTVILVLYCVAADPVPWLPLRPFGDFHAVPQFVGAILLSVKTAGIIMPIKNQMKRPGNFDGQHSILMSTYLPISLLYPCFSFICSLRYGSELGFSVLQNLPKDSFSNVAFMLVTLAYMLQFPLTMYVPFDLLWNNMLKDGKKKIRAPKVWEYSLRTILVLLTYVLSAAEANITMFVAVCGTIATAIDSFLMPAIMQTLVLWKTSQSKTTFCYILAMNTFTIVVAVILIILGIFDCYYQIMKHVSR